MELLSEYQKVFAPMGLTKVPQQGKVYLRVWSTGWHQWKAALAWPGQTWACLSLSFTSPDTLEKSRSPPGISLFICKLKWLISVTANGYLVPRWHSISDTGNYHWRKKVLVLGNELLVSGAFCSSLLPLKCCISLRVHKSWHVCKERHGRNLYASPYNKHVVNNLYLEYNLS